MKRLFIVIMLTNLLLPFFAQESTSSDRLPLLFHEPTFREMRRDKSTRGVDFSLKAIGSPSGYFSVYNAKGYVPWGVGGEAVLRYRLNKAFSFGIGLNYIVAAFDRGENRTGSSSLFLDLKVNFKEKRKFTPYMSLSFGFDWYDMLVNSFGETIWTNPTGVYAKNPFSMILTPAGGLDFPLRHGAAFVEARFDYRITDLYLPSFAVGYTF